jgi:hypothetical protein
MHLKSPFSLILTLTLVVTTVTVGRGRADAQPSPASERDAIVRLHVERGGRAEDIAPLLRQIDDASAKGLPVSPLTNKIREGLAKSVAVNRIEMVIRQIAGQLETADRLLREFDSSIAPAGRETPVTLLAESFGSGITSDEVRELRRLAVASGAALSPDALAGAAKALSFMKEARLSVGDGTAVMVEAGRQRFRPYEMIDVGREVKRREADYQSGRASLRALRDAIARGDRPDQLFRDSRPGGQPERPGSVERPASSRPEAPVTRPERPEPQRREPPARPEPVRPR